MPIIIPDTLPAAEVLRQEKIFVMDNERAYHQDIRPLEIIILNLMPEKVMAENQLLRLLSNTPLQIKLTLLKTASYKATNTSEAHLKTFYKTFDQIKSKRFDGLIITGAPVEHLPFEAVGYWDELKEIMTYAKKHVTSTLHLCWGAQAGLYHYYQINKYKVKDKIFGIFKHDVRNENHVLLKGFDSSFMMPHSRYSITRLKDVNHPDLDLLSYSEEAGVSIVASKDLKHVFVSGHPEYTQETLAGEYFRDLDKGKRVKLPSNYYLDDDVKNAVEVTWRSHANLLFSNWINYCVYQQTPYIL